MRLALSEAGRALYAALLPRVAEINQRLMSVLSVSEAATLQALLQRLGAQALCMDGAAPSPVRQAENSE